MIPSLIKLRSFFFEGQERSVTVKKNIAISLLIKSMSMGIGFLLIPMTINYVNPRQYGMWLTLSSTLSWFTFFDIGLGNGLRNKLSEKNALGENVMARIYISTTYAILAFISSVIFIIFLFLNRFINWNEILNVSDFPHNELNTIVLVIAGFFCLQFVVQLINIVLTAMHAPAKASGVNLIGQVFCITFIYFLSVITKGTLLILVLVLAGIPPLIQFFASLWFFRTSYKALIPGIKLIRLKYAKDLLGIGFIFFIIQMGVLVIFQTDNIVITQLFGPGEVTTFNIAYKLFSIIISVFTIIMTPMWSAFTDAYAKKDMEWIKNVMGKLHRLCLKFLLFTIIIVIFSPLIYKLWIGKKILVPLSLSIATGAFVIMFLWLTIQCFLLNGVGKVRLQLYLYIFSATVNIPLSIFFGKMVGLWGITLANIICIMMIALPLTIQSKKVIDNNALGIWNK